MATGAEPTQAPGWGLFAQWHVLIDRGDPRFTFVSTVEDVAQPLALSGGLDQGEPVEHAAPPHDRLPGDPRRGPMPSLRRRGVSSG